MIISFIGPADSGKSMLINLLVNNNLFYGKEIIVHQDKDLLLVDIFKKIFGIKFAKNYNANIMSTDIVGKRTPRLPEIYFLVSILIEFYYFYFKYKYFKKNSIFICDRYVYDYVVTFNQNLKVDNKIINYILLKFPRPEVLFYVKSSPANLLRRNKNKSKFELTTSLRFQKRVCEGYDTLARVKNAFIITNNKDVGHAVEQVSFHVKNLFKIMGIDRLIIFGMDGSGKSTLISEISDYFGKFGKSTIIVHFFHDTILYKLLKTIGFFKEDGDLKKKRIRARIVVNKGKSFLWAFLNIADANLQILLSKIYGINKIVIYDRYTYDFLVSFRLHKVPYIRHLIKLVKPQRNSYLVISNPEVVYKRKPENTKKYFTNAYRIYLKVANEFGFKILNTSRIEKNQMLNKFLKILS